MATDKKPNYVVIHKNYNTRVEGKLAKLPLGTQIYIEPARAKTLLKRRFIASLQDAKTIDMSKPTVDTK
jgi:hypothetical protein